ncbi:hypothetical protein FRC04_008364 [Tulasnella sp. 424]|nr:hypothetical protein FRC04_008364 [Tulasnella sp. 424]KAG8976736.1 hypothetical protein FRC05_003086 [Tulasnella sp. 425]
MSSNTASPSPTSSPSRPKPSRKATSRSATPPSFKATLNRRSSLAAPVAATTAEHTYFTPAEPTAAVDPTPAAVPDEPQPISNAPPASLQFDPGVTFPAASEQISAPEQQQIPDQNNEDMSRERSDSGASVSRRSTMFGNLARPLRRSSSASEGGASAPALASLLETQQRDQAARDAVKARSSIDAASSDVGSGSEAESNPLAPRRKPKRQNTFSKMVGNLGNVVRRRKTSDGSIEAAAAATAIVAPPTLSTEEVSLLSPPAQTSGPTSTIVSPIAETSEVTSPIGQESMPIPAPVENKEVAPAAPVAPEAPEAPVEPSVDLGSPPASPTVEVAPFTIQPAVTPLESPPALNIEESGVLVEPAHAEVEVASAITKMTPVSSAAADSTFKQKQEEPAQHREVEADQENDWEKVGEPQQVRPQASFVYTDDGSLADDSASSFVERNRQAGPSVISSLKDRIKPRGGIEDEQASTMATMGDPTDPNERVPPTPYTAAFLAKESTQKEFTPPITPDSDKFPEIPRSRQVGSSKLGGGDLDEKTSFPGNYKESAAPIDDDGVDIDGGLSALIPSRETVDMAAQYAVPTLEVHPSQESQARTLSVETSNGVPASTGEPPGFRQASSTSTAARPLTQEEDLDATVHSPTSNARPVSQYTSIAATLSTPNPSTTPPQTASTTVYTTPGIALRHLSTSSRTYSIHSSPPHSPRQRPPPPVVYSLWDILCLPLTIPFAITRNAISFSFRTFIFGVVFGVTVVRLGAHAVGGRFLGRRM